MHVLCNVIVGHVFTGPMRDYLRSILNNGSIFPSKYIQEELRGDGDDEPFFVGVCIRRFDGPDNLNDGCESLKLSKLLPFLKPSQKQILKATKMIAHTKSQLEKFMKKPPTDIEFFNDEPMGDRAIKRLLKSIPDKPEVFLLWS